MWSKTKRTKLYRFIGVVSVALFLVTGCSSSGSDEVFDFRIELHPVKDNLVNPIKFEVTLYDQVVASTRIQRNIGEAIIPVETGWYVDLKAHSAPSECQYLATKVSVENVETFQVKIKSSVKHAGSWLGIDAAESLDLGRTGWNAVLSEAICEKLHQPGWSAVLASWFERNQPFTGFFLSLVSGVLLIFVGRGIEKRAARSATDAGVSVESDDQ